MALTQPRKDAEFIAWALNVDVQCTQNQANWQLDAGKVQTLNALTASAHNAYLANENPETRNRLTTASKRMTFASLRSFFSTYVPVLVANEAISEDALAGMGLPSRQHHFHTPLPVPTEAPEVSAVVGQHHEITVYVNIPQHGQPSEFLSKKGYHGFVVRYRKDGDAEWTEEHSTSLHHMLFFDSEDEGKHLTLTVAWINPRIERGPWSDEIRVLIN
jgi:hypothetical protein